ncbi:MAG: 50S ribosomal protein L25 [Thermodesulfobacteriota bacterium]
MEILELNASIRKATGNSPSRALRRQGMLPAVLYGPGRDTLPLTIVEHDLELALRKAPAGRIVFTLHIHNGETTDRTAMIKDIQVHPLKRRAIHVDFYEVSKDRKITARVPVIAEGKAKGIENGGMLQIICREVEVSCLPYNVPDAIRIDIAALDIGDAIHIRDLHKMEQIDFLDDPDQTVLVISGTMGSDRPEYAAAAAASEPEKVEKTAKK